MNQSEHPTQKAPSPTANNALVAGPLNWVLRLRGWFRPLLIPYLVLIGVGGFLSIIAAGYGLAHASAASTAAFFLTLTGVGAVLAAPALILLKKNQSKGATAVEGLVMLFMGGVILLVLVTAFNMIIKPQINGVRFEALAKSVRTEYAGESPIMLQGRQVGINVVTDIILPTDLELNYHGHAITRAMRDAGRLVYTMGDASPVRADMTREGRLEKMYGMSGELSAVTVQMPNGRPLDSFPGVKEAFEFFNYERKPGSPVVLPKGRYRKTVSYWFDGISTVQTALINKNVELRQVPQQYRLPQRDAAGGATVAELDWPNLTGKLCKANNPFAFWNEAAIGKLRGDETTWTTESSASGSVSLKGPNRRGPYKSFDTRTAIKAAFVPAVWARAHAELDLPSCDRIVAAVTQELARGADKKQVEAVAKTDVPINQLPLYAALCGNDTAGVQSILQKGEAELPRWYNPETMNQVLFSCTHQPLVEGSYAEQYKPVDVNAIAMVVKKSVLPDAVRKSDDPYCKALYSWHKRRQIDVLEALATQKTPIDCNRESPSWVAGAIPGVLPQSNGHRLHLRDNATRADLRPWVNVITKSGMNLCDRPTVSRSTGVPGGWEYTTGFNLLDLYARDYPPDVLLQIAQRGCDHKSIPPANWFTSSYFSNGDLYTQHGHISPISPAAWWYLRRTIQKEVFSDPSEAAAAKKMDALFVPSDAEKEVLKQSSAEYFRR